MSFTENSYNDAMENDAGSSSLLLPTDPRLYGNLGVLPPELRDHIFEFSLEIKHHQVSAKLPDVFWSECVLPFGLALANRTIRSDLTQNKNIVKTIEETGPTIHVRYPIRGERTDVYDVVKFLRVVGSEGHMMDAVDEMDVAAEFEKRSIRRRTKFFERFKYDKVSRGYNHTMDLLLDIMFPHNFAQDRESIKHLAMKIQRAQWVTGSHNAYPVEIQVLVPNQLPAVLCSHPQNVFRFLRTFTRHISMESIMNVAIYFSVAVVTEQNFDASLLAKLKSACREWTNMKFTDATTDDMRLIMMEYDNQMDLDFDEDIEYCFEDVD